MLNRIERFAKRSDLVSFLDRNCLRRPYFQTIERTFLELKRVETLSLSEKVELQKQRMLALLNHAQANCPYYNEVFSKRGINIKSLDHLSKIPFLTKEIVREHGSEMISRKTKRISLVRRNTGGSTGEPLEFYSDRDAGAIDLAHHKFLYDLMGHEPGDIIAGGAGISVPKGHRDKGIFWVRGSKYSIWWHLCFSGLYLNENTIKSYIEHFLKVKPSILRGYPSFWDTIATYLLTHNIKLDFKVKGVNLTAEICLDTQRERIEKAFSTKVFFEYGQGELTVFCYTNGSLPMYQTAPLYGYIEVVKDNGEPAKPNEEGEVIATSLCNQVMPFIRYRTGDRVVVSRREGGMIWFEHFDGRTQDYVLDKNNQKVAITSLIFGQHFKAFKNITQWQLRQDRIGHMLITIARGSSYTEKDEREIVDKIKNSACLDLSFQYTDQIPLSKNGKFSFLIRNC
jgi:phenylacetate-CoA ligase